VTGVLDLWLKRGDSRRDGLQEGDAQDAQESWLGFLCHVVYRSYIRNRLTSSAGILSS